MKNWLHDLTFLLKQFLNGEIGTLFKMYRAYPINIEHTLHELKTALIISIRSHSWLPLNEVYETLLKQNPSISTSSSYRRILKKIYKQTESLKNKIGLSYINNLMTHDILRFNHRPKNNHGILLNP
jgi:hypothetical protein